MEVVEFDYSGSKQKIPLPILNALQAMKYSDSRIYLMTPRDRFIAYCNWEGLVNWGDTLWDAVVLSTEK